MSNKNLIDIYSEVFFYYPTDRSQLEGRLLTFIETLGFDSKREKSVKDIVRETLHDFFTKSGYLEGEDAKFVYNAYQKALKKIEKEYEFHN